MCAEFNLSNFPIAIITTFISSQDHCTVLPLVTTLGTGSAAIFIYLRFPHLMFAVVTLVNMFSILYNALVFLSGINFPLEINYLLSY